jgi:hypothetical protein
VHTRAERPWLQSACIVLWLCAAAVPAFASGEYRTVAVESLEIQIDSEWANRAAPGYVPVRFDIRNLGESRIIEIIGRGTRYLRVARGREVGGTDVRQAVRLARGDRVRLTIPVPIFGDSDSILFEIHEDGRLLERFNYTGYQLGSLAAEASALIVVSDATSPYGALASTWSRSMNPSAVSSVGPTGRHMPTGGVGGPPLDFLLSPGRLPTNWLGYTSLRAVFVGPTEWESLSDAQKSALLTWIACGGDLFFVDGDLRALLPSDQHHAADADDRAPHALFFGRIHRPTSASIAATGLENVLTAAQKVRDPDWALPANSARVWGAVSTRGFKLPIPGIEGVPARAYVSILLVFSLIIGPANYWFLKRNRRQVLLVLTAPLISAMFIVLLAGYVLAGEGLGVRGRAVSITMLDQVRNQAATRSTASLYAAGMAPFGGLRFSRDVAVLPIGPEGQGARGRQTLDLTDAQRFSSGVIQARSPTNIEQFAFRTARERLSFSRESGGMTVVNGLGATVTALSYREGDTVYTLTRPVPPGSKGTLTIGTAAIADLVSPFLWLKERVEHLFQHQPVGSYLAVLDRSPFWEPGVSDVDERGSFHLVIGWPGGQP